MLIIVGKIMVNFTSFLNHPIENSVVHFKELMIIVIDAKTTDCTIYGPMKLLFATNFDQTDFSSFIECHWNKWKVLPFILLRRKYRVGAETVTEWRSSNQLCHHLRPLSMEFQLSHLVSYWILVAKRAPVMSILIEGLPLRKVIFLYS